MRRKGSAPLRTWGTAIVIFWFGLHFRAHAGYDLNIGGSLRSYPLSGVISVESGYGLLLWGKPSPWYGYLRPRLNVDSAATYNAFDGGLEFYPISFLGGRAGGEAVQNDHDYSAYDCVTYLCHGRFYRTYVQADLTLGAGPVFMQLRWRRERWTLAEARAVRFIEPTSGFALDGLGDAETIYRGLLGVKLAPGWAVLAGLTYAESGVDHGLMRFPFALVRYTRGPWSAGVGGGVFSSPLKREEASALLFLNWEIKPSLTLR
jgi:hypothetical protein